VLKSVAEVGFNVITRRDKQIHTEKFLVHHRRHLYKLRDGAQTRQLIQTSERVIALDRHFLCLGDFKSLLV